MAIKFIMGLNHHYNEYKGYYINCLRDWPDTLDKAYMDAAKFNPYQKHAAGQSQAGFERANAFAATGRGRGGKGGRGRGRGRGGYAGGPYGKNTQSGHWVRDGPESPKEFQLMDALYNLNDAISLPRNHKQFPFSITYILSRDDLVDNSQISPIRFRSAD